MKIDIPVISETIITGTAYGRRKTARPLWSHRSLPQCKTK